MGDVALFAKKVNWRRKDKSYVGGIPIARASGEILTVATSGYEGKYKPCFEVSILLVR